MKSYEVHKFFRRIEVAIHLVAVEFSAIEAKHERADTVERMLKISRVKHPLHRAGNILVCDEEPTEENLRRHE